MAESVHTRYVQRLPSTAWTDWPDSSTDPAPGARSCSGSCSTPPWSVRLEDEAPLSVTAVVRGQPVGLPGRRGADPARGRRRRGRVGSDHWTIADDPATPTQVVDPPRPGLHHRRRPRRRRGDEPGRAQLGQQRGRRDRAAHRCLPDRGRGDPAAAPRAAALRWSCARTSSTPRSSTCSATRSSRDAPGPGRRARPAPRPAADRRCCAPGSTGREADPPAWYAAPGRPRRRPRAPADAAPPRAPLDRRGPRRRRRGLPRRRSPGASPSSWASRRWRS